MQQEQNEFSELIKSIPTLITTFFNNLDSEDKKEMAHWTTEDFLKYVEEKHPFALFDDEGKIIAMGDAVVDGLNCNLWLLVTPDVRKYSNMKRLIIACAEIIAYKVDRIYGVYATTLSENKSHRAFIEKVLDMKTNRFPTDNQVEYFAYGAKVLNAIKKHVNYRNEE